MEKSQIEIDLEEEFKATAPNADELKQKIEEYNAKEEENTETDEGTKGTDSSEPESEGQNRNDDKLVESNEKNESETTEPIAETEPEEPQELILGKFKSVDDLKNAYTNLQKAYSQKSQQVSETAKISNPTEFDKMVDQQIAKASWDLLNKAMTTITDPEQYKEASLALEQYRRIGDDSYLEKARGYLDRRVDRKLDIDYMNTSAAIRQEANKYRDESELRPIAETLTAMEDEDKDWMAEESHQNILAASIQLNRQVDLRSVKKMIQACEDKAVERYKASEAKKNATKAEKKTVITPKAPDRPEPEPIKRDWREMSIEDQLKEEMKGLLG